ncbi:MAG TPA: succinate dehydrogenase, cytochrome b556 subunit [Steroidobacteraceae bacterium]|nr:succinate dehydrogenase, cytochrome b556 subunit [Steroidobacteraceae bacterium]
MSPQSRPLSPHLQVYRPMYTMVLSMSHRISGVFQSVGMLLLAYWLVAAASGAGAYATAAKLFGSPLVKLAIVGWIVAFWFHLFAGLRHLVWDAGYGFEKRTARRSARLVVVLASLASLFTLALAWRHLGGGA